MPNMTLSLDDETFEEIKAHPDIRWSEVARDALRRRIRELHYLDDLAADSRLSEADVEAIAKEVNKGLRKSLAD